MIVDAQFLREEFVPQEVVHRDAEVNHLSNVLDPIMRDERTDPALLTGPSGAGKTCIARFIVKRLRQEHLDVEHQYVNCWQDFSRFKALYRILEGVGKTVDIHRQSTPRDELVERLREYDGPPCVVIFDEVDQLEDKSVLYDVHTEPKYSLILIANRETDFFADMDERIVSRLRACERIQFDRYDLDELVAILEARAERGLAENAVGEPKLQRIADAAAGDARVALSILRNAARRADREHIDRLTDDLIEAAIPEAKAELRQKDINALTPDQRILFDIINEHGEVVPSELYNAYRARVSDPKSDRMVRNYLHKLQRYNLIDVEGTSRDRVYRRVRRKESEAAK